MSINLKNLLVVMITLSGVFCYSGAWKEYALTNEDGIFYISQLIFFLTASGIFGGYLVSSYNKFIGYMAWLLSFGFMFTFLFDHAPKVYMYESALIGYSFFIIYYFFRKYELKEDLLKFLMIPLCLNIALVFVQGVDKTAINLLYTGEPTAFIGNKGMAGAYIGLLSPIFLRYWKPGYILALIAMCICDGFIGMIAAIGGGLFYLYFTNRKMFIIFLACIVIFSGSVALFNKGYFATVKNDAHNRVAMMVGVLDGIKHNPIMGWGVGSFIPVVSQIKPEDSEYLGYRFNSIDTVNNKKVTVILNHPHNEILSGWWKVGIGFPILIIFIIINLIKKFNISKVLPASILVSGSVISLGWFFTLPALLALIVALGIYENQ